MHITNSNQPRYLQVAHWLLAQQQWMTARQVAVVFDVSPKQMCDDFAVLRQRTDLFTLDETSQKCRNGCERLIKVISIHPYSLDGRRYPRPVHCKSTLSNAITSNITWGDLVSRPWHRLAN